MRRSLVVGVLAGMVALAACAPKPRYTSATHVDPIRGNCDHGRTLQVGAVLDLSGPGRALGAAYLDGLRAAADAANNQRGVLKDHRCVELLYKDDRGDPHVGDRAVLSLVNDEGVAVLVAPFTSSVVTFSRVDIGLDGVPTLSFSPLGLTYDPHHFHNTYPLVPSDAVQAGLLADAVKAQGWRRVAVAVGNEPVGQEQAAALAQALGAAGVLAGPPETIDSGAGTAGTAGAGGAGGAGGGASGTSGAAAGLGRLQRLNPDGLVVVGEGGSIRGALAARSSLGWSVPTFTGAAATDPGVIDQLSAAQLAGVAAIGPKPSVEPAGAGGAGASGGGATGGGPAAQAVAAFRDGLAGRLGGELPGSIVAYAQAYDGLAMIISVANAVHSARPADIRTYLENANYEGLLAGYSYTASRHDGVQAADLTMVDLASLHNGLFGAAFNEAASGSVTPG